MNGWIKYYLTGDKVFGEDCEVRARRVSWRNSPLHGMCAAEICHNGLSLKLCGLGPFWQSDGYESVFPGPSTVLVKRRVECLVQPEDNYIGIEFRPHQSLYTITISQLCPPGDVVAITPEWHNKWLILELDLRAHDVRYYLSENRV